MLNRAEEIAAIAPPRRRNRIKLGKDDAFAARQGESAALSSISMGWPSALSTSTGSTFMREIRSLHRFMSASSSRIEGGAVDDEFLSAIVRILHAV